MSERIPPSFARSIVMLMIAIAVPVLILLWLFDGIIARLVIAAAGFFVLRKTWSSTRRKRELATRGYFTGRRVGNQWIYEELHAGEVVAIELPLAYAGRGEFEILIPGEGTWPARVPAWARDRRAEIIDRLGTVFRRSDMRIDD